MLPFFKRSEAYEGGASEWHGASGELGVSDLRNDHPYCEAWLAAGAEAGYPLTPDFNGAQPDGLGRYQLTLRGRWRCDAATAFLAPVRARPNLTIATGAQVTRIVVEAGQRARHRVGRGRRLAACDGHGGERKGRARRRRGHRRRRRAAVAAAAAALGHRPGGAAAPARHRRRRRFARGRAQPAGPLPGARDRQAEGEALAQRRRPQPASPRADGRAVAVPSARPADGRRRPGRRPGRDRARARRPRRRALQRHAALGRQARRSAAPLLGLLGVGGAVPAGVDRQRSRSRAPIRSRRRASAPATSPIRATPRSSSPAFASCARSTRSRRFAASSPARSTCPATT